MRILMNFSIIFVLFLLFLTGCGKKVTGDEKTAAEYVEAHGYKITSNKGQIESYSLDKSKLIGSVESVHNAQIWGVQKEEPDKYFGKEITLYGFTVENHLLEKIYNVKTNVSIMLCEGKVIGGTSFPIQGKELIAGAPYSFEGKTLDEVKGLSFKDWTEKWKKKYSN